MSSRDLVLGRIRSALAGTAPAPPIPRDYHRTGTLFPGSPEVIDRLVDRLEDYRATVHLITPTTPPGDQAALAAAIDTALGDARTVVLPPGLPEPMRVGAGTRTVTLDDALLTADDLDHIDAVLTAARIAVADTGTIILDAAPDQGRRAISLIPDRHVIVLRADQVVQTVSEALTHLDPGAALTLISGPSATSDIELSRVEGVHGPRTLHVVIC